MGKIVFASLFVVVALGGCSQAQYQGTSPSWRNVGGTPEARTSYVGMNFNFAVEPPLSYHAAPKPDFTAASATASVE